MAGVVTMLTDFGLRDGYVAAMKGAMLTRAPELRFVDVSHEVPPGDVEAAAYVLLQAAPQFPPDTVHLVVVDPGVGSERRALAGRLGRHYFVAPDNGVLTHVLQGAPVSALHVVSNPDFAPAEASPVFHGRDVFGPVAAFLAAGGSIASLGPSVDADSLAKLPLVPPSRAGDATTGVIIHVDGFGNLISNLRLTPGRWGSVEFGAHRVPLARTYGDVAAGELVAVCGSSGFLEVARNGGSAAELTGGTRGDVITLRIPQRS